ncbi:MAG: lysyl oxidase family protein [Polyangiales bacterium]
MQRVESKVTLAPATSSALTVTASSVPTRVAPGGALEVSISLRNTSNRAWLASDASLVFSADGGWTTAVLALSGTTRPNQVGTFSGRLGAPRVPGVYALQWQLVVGGAVQGTVGASTEVTCSDGLFCNGEERWVDGQCQPGPAPCDDGQNCTTDTCDESAGVCDHAATGNCAVCNAPNCVPHCNRRSCGDDGCGGSCGTCVGGQTCVEGACATVVAPGTCANPLPLIAAGVPVVGSHIVQGDTSTGVNGTVPHCNRASTARDLVYTFTLTETLAIDARVSGYDTVLSLRTGACADSDPAMRTQPNWCSDDASPPGNYGSRIATMLPAGTYYLLVDGYNGQQQGPFDLSVRFVRDCVPQCDGKYCGDDGCGGSCGACGAGQVCSPSSNRCVSDPCTPDCRGRQCGNDGCGGSCGTCARGDTCIESTGACRAIRACDHLRPTCATPCSRNQFCGSDCQCHRLRDPLPDLVVDRATLERDIVINSARFGSASCAVFEGCIAAPGTRTLLRFSVAAVNQGSVDLTAPDVATSPQVFEFSPCHGHYHYSGFANYELRALDGRVVTRGRKQAYCMEDSFRARQGPALACTNRYTCESQGIQAGWADLYGNDLDCQWIDITDVPPGSYLLAVTVNPTRTFQEISFDNNTTVVPVTIP